MIVPLYPLSLLYKGITQSRNALYDRGYFRSFSFDRMLISVGNLSVGGTGKTPMVEYLIRLLQTDYKLATLSRGYGRSTSGFRLAGPQDNADTLGDEPYQYYRNWQNSVAVAVGEDRALAITSLLAEKPEVDIILLDDAYQHRRVRPDLNLLLTTYRKPFWQDRLLPAGRLRESRKGAQRAQALIITKCPENLSAAGQEQMTKAAKVYLSEGVPVFFSTIAYGAPEALFRQANAGATSAKKAAILISGLANAQPFETWAADNYELLEHHQYSDHHRFTKANITRLRKAYEQHSSNSPLILTSEKDAVRLLQADLKEMLEELPVYYIPIRQRFLNRSAEAFNLFITKSIAEKLGDRS